MLSWAPQTLVLPGQGGCAKMAALPSGGRGWGPRTLQRAAPSAGSVAVRPLRYVSRVSWLAPRPLRYVFCGAPLSLQPLALRPLRRAAGVTQFAVRCAVPAGIASGHLAEVNGGAGGALPAAISLPGIRPPFQPAPWRCKRPNELMWVLAPAPRPSGGAWGEGWPWERGAALRAARSVRQKHSRWGGERDAESLRCRRHKI